MLRTQLPSFEQSPFLSQEVPLPLSEMPGFKLAIEECLQQLPKVQFSQSWTSAPKLVENFLTYPSTETMELPASKHNFGIKGQLSWEIASSLGGLHENQSSS